MSKQAIKWVLEEAPGLPPHLAMTLAGLAASADEDGRNASQPLESLVRRTRKSGRSVRRDLHELEALGLIRPGDPKIVAGVPAKRHQVVYDLVLERTISAESAGERQPRRRSKVSKAKLARIRLAVYQRAGFRCEHCGWAPSVPAGYDGTYALCEMEPSARRYGKWVNRTVLRWLQLDHIYPHVLGGKFEENNLQALCSLCNVRKGARV